MPYFNTTDICASAFYKEQSEEQLEFQYLRLKRAHELINDGNYFQAEKILERLIVRNGGRHLEDETHFYRSYHGLIEYYLCLDRLRKHKFAKDLEQVFFPIDICYWLLGRIYYYIGDSQKSLTMLEMAVSWNPTRAEIYWDIAGLYQKAGDMEGYLREAQRSYSYAWKSEQIARILRMYGYYYWESGQDDAAQACYIHSRIWDPFSTEAIESLGNMRKATCKPLKEMTRPIIKAMSQEYGFPIGPEHNLLLLVTQNVKIEKRRGNLEGEQYWRTIKKDLTKDRRSTP